MMMVEMGRQQRGELPRFISDNACLKPSDLYAIL